MNDSIKKKIDDLVQSNDICLFMKGTPEVPQCGFSLAISNSDAWNKFLVYCHNHPDLNCPILTFFLDMYVFRLYQLYCYQTFSR